MKFKEKRGNTFVFDGGYAGEELELEYRHFDSFEFQGKNLFGSVVIDKEMNVSTCPVSGYFRVPFSDIQNAANLVQILIKEGLV